MFRKVCLVALVCLVSVLAGSLPAFAQDLEPTETGRFRLGPLSFTPSIAVTNVGLDDNVFNEADEPKRDSTAAIGPSTTFWMKLGRSRLSGKTSGQYLYFRRYDRERAWNTLNEARWDIGLGRVTPFLAGTYTNTRERPGYEIDARARRRDQSVTGGSQVRLSGKTTLVASAQWTRMQFDDDQIFLGTSLAEALDRRADTALLQVRYKLTPLTTLVLNAETGRDRFLVDSLRDSDSVKVMSGFELKPLALISGRAAVGYRHFNTLNGDVPDYRGVIASVDATYALASTRVQVKLDRDLAYSYQPTEPYYALLDLGLAVTKRVTRTWDLTGRVGWQSLGYQRVASSNTSGDRVDHGTRYGAGAGYRIGETLRLGVDIDYYARRSQSLISREFDGLRVGGSFSYGLQQ